MSFNISYIFEIQDKMTAKLNKISRQMQGFSGKVQQQTQKIQDSFDNMSGGVSRSLSKFQNTIQSVSNKIGKYIPQAFKDIPIWVELYLEQAGNKMKKFNNKMQNFSQKMFAFRNQALFISAPVALFGKNAYDDFASYETLLLQMRTTFGETADAMIKEGNRIADSTALAPEQAFQLLSKIKQTGNLDNQAIVKVTNDLINTVYGVGASKQFDRIAWQFSQVLTKGELELEDIKTMAEAGLPIFTMLGDTLKKTPQQLLDIIGTKGAIGVSAKNIIDMLDKYGNIHKNAQEKFANSAEGKLQILSESYSKFSRKFGELMDEAGYRDMIDDLTKFFNFLSEKIDKMSPTAKKFVFYFTLLAVILPPILMTIGLIAATVGLISAGLGVMGVAVAPFFAISTLIIGIVAGIVIFRKEIWSVVELAGNGLKKLFTWIGDKIDSIVNKFNAFRKALGFMPSGVDEGQDGKKPKPIGEDGGMSFMQQVVQNRAGATAKADVNVNFANMPKGSNVQTKTRGADFLKLGINSLAL